MLVATKNLVHLTYEGKEVFMNSLFSRPLIFNKGAEQVKAAIKNPDSIEDNALLNLLKKFKILVEEEEIAPKTHQQFLMDGKKDLGLYMLVTQKCNLGCTYCLGDNPSYLNQHSMDFTIAKLALEKSARAMRKKGNIQIIYFGGEPLLNWALIKQCIEFVENELKMQFDVNFKHHVTTNLTTLPSDFIEVAEKHNVSILVDIDGRCDLHNKMRPYRNGNGSYDSIIKNLEKISKSDIYYELRATVTSENVEYLPGILKHHRNLNPAACAFPTLIPVNSEGLPLNSNMFPDPDVYSAKLKDVIKEQLFDLSCVCPSNVISARMLRGEYVVYGCGMILGNTAVVNHNGDIFPCIYFVGQKEFCLGNLEKDHNPLSQENWYEKFWLKHERKLHVDNLNECHNCAIRYYCGGGCSVRMLSLQCNDLASKNAKDYFYNINCKASWASVESAIKYFEDKTQKGHAYIKTNPARKSQELTEC